MPEGDRSTLSLQPNAGGILEALERNASNVYRTAMGKGMRLSAWLDEELDVDPSKDRLDGFGQCMKVAEIKLASDYERGITANNFGEWEDHPQARALIPEWIGRTWRRCIGPNRRAYGMPQGGQRAPFGSVDWPALTIPQVNPWTGVDYYDPNIHIAPLTPVFPLDQLVAGTINIRGDSYRSFYLIDNPLTERLVRVTEFAELPKARLAQGEEHAVRLYKYGRALEISYEAMRRMQLDMLAFWIQRLALNAERDKLAVILDVLLNGDGNSNTSATNYNLTTLDSAAVAGTLTLKGWLNFKLKFRNPFVLNTALMQEDVALQLMMLNTGSANLPLIMAFPDGRFGSITPMNTNPSTTGDAVRIGWDDTAPASKIVGYDRRFAVLRIVEIGADISEVERFITRQTQITTMSETEGYAILDFNGTRVLNLAS